MECFLKTLFFNNFFSTFLLDNNVPKALISTLVMYHCSQCLRLDDDKVMTYSIRAIIIVNKRAEDEIQMFRNKSIQKFYATVSR